MTPSPRQRAEAIMAKRHRPQCNDTWWFEDEITTAIQAALNEELERGRARLADAKQALQAALEDLARVTKERDGLAERLADSGDRMARIRNERDELRAIFEDLAAHDRNVAARVLRKAACGYSKDAVCDWQTTHLTVRKELMMFADQYERGEREVPGE